MSLPEPASRFAFFLGNRAADEILEPLVGIRRIIRDYRPRAVGNLNPALVGLTAIGSAALPGKEAAGRAAIIERITCWFGGLFHLESPKIKPARFGLAGAYVFLCSRIFQSQSPKETISASLAHPSGKKEFRR